jgi:hypothetical protein
MDSSIDAKNKSGRRIYGNSNEGKPMKFHTIAAVILSASSFLWAGTASAASLITNGTFDTDLSGWTETGIGADWVAGAANLGQPGTPGPSTFSQSFELTNANVAGSFSFEWQVTPPTGTQDVFSVDLEYQTTGGGTATVTLFGEGSDSGQFGTTVSQGFSTALTDFAVGTATLIFSLQEFNDPNGTRVRLDNVALSQVPLPAAAWLFGSALLGLLTVARRRQA